MDTPDIKRRNYGRGHGYTLDGQKVPGVTTIISDGLPKPALMGWAAKTIAEYVADRLDQADGHVLADQLVDDLGELARVKGKPWPDKLSRTKVAELLKGIHYEDRDQAAKRGTQVHALAERLAATGYIVIPHLAARMIRGRAELAEIVARLEAVGITGIFVPGGDATPGADNYDSAYALLCDLATMPHPFTQIGVAGYPESHPSIVDDVLVQAMWDAHRLEHDVRRRPRQYLAAEGAPPWRHPTGPHWVTGASRAHEALVDGDHNWRRRIHAIPHQAKGCLRTDCRTWLQPGEVSAAARPPGK